MGFPRAAIRRSVVTVADTVTPVDYDESERD